MQIPIDVVLQCTVCLPYTRMLLSYQIQQHEKYMCNYFEVFDVCLIRWLKSQLIVQ